jgi:oligosaccharyltransferase complex subunit epsilon
MGEFPSALKLFKLAFSFLRTAQRNFHRRVELSPYKHHKTPQNTQAYRQQGTKMVKAKTVKTQTKKESAWSGFSQSLSVSYESYFEALSPRLKLVDTFLVFLVLVALVQFVFCILVGSFPFNAFLGGFISTVGQFVLTVSLRLQTLRQNDKIFKNVSPERAIGDYIFASLILHFTVYHFIN